MFSGIIEEVAPIQSLYRKSGCYELKVKSKLVAQDVSNGESVAVDGVCLTLTGKTKDVLIFDIMESSYKNTGFEYLKAGSYVNLERALRINAPLSGHLVSGHIDTVLEVYRYQKKKESNNIFIKIPSQYLVFVVDKGSIALNGVSLTIQEVKGNVIAVGVIPYTLRETNLRDLRVGCKLNVEFDILAKYVANYLKNIKH
ncbi:MAG: riboflavin synthase [Candidatus Saelkia tenebricola]|nr:riboflavin synthase [Candidatus Saelkia tenebricola]